MKAYIAWLVLLAGLSIVLQPVAAVKFSIHVLDNGKPVENAYIRILDGTNLVKNGNSDSNGLFVVYLNGGKYTIRAQHYDKYDEKKDYVLDSSESEVFLNLH
jgi:uncharacterized GH25 family protein